MAGLDHGGIVPVSLQLEIRGLGARSFLGLSSFLSRHPAIEARLKCRVVGVPNLALRIMDMNVDRASHG